MCVKFELPIVEVEVIETVGLEKLIALLTFLITKLVAEAIVKSVEEVDSCLIKNEIAKSASLKLS